MNALVFYLYWELLSSKLLQYLIWTFAFYVISLGLICRYFFKHIFALLISRGLWFIQAYDPTVQRQYKHNEGSSPAHEAHIDSNLSCFSGSAALLVKLTFMVFAWQVEIQRGFSCQVNFTAFSCQVEIQLGFSHQANFTAFSYRVGIQRDFSCQANFTAFSCQVEIQRVFSFTLTWILSLHGYWRWDACEWKLLSLGV